MRRSSLVALVAFVAGLALILPTFVPPADADHRWDAIGPLFRIGGIAFAIALGQPFLSAPHGYYYRAADPFDYRGVRCSSACFRDRDHFYHHEGCPVVRHHFTAYGVDYDHLHSRYAPGWNDRYGYRDRYDRYDDRYDRYDRRDRYDRHDRYDKRDRGGYRGHGQYRGHGRYRDGRGHGKGHRHHDHDRDRCPYDHDHD